MRTLKNLKFLAAFTLVGIVMSCGSLLDGVEAKNNITGDIYKNEEDRKSVV